MDTQTNGSNSDKDQKNLGFHPNGIRRFAPMTRPKTHDDDQLVFEDVFPDSHIGKLLRGLVVVSLCKQEHRIGWARKSACDDQILLKRPNETVASHQWGLAIIIMSIGHDEKFQKEMPDFDLLKAYEMALTHDIPEIVTGDITPVDPFSPDEKHKLEKEASDKIFSCFPPRFHKYLSGLYNGYEERESAESKVVKDCDRLDFIIYTFLLERQGFTGIEEFYRNTCDRGFFTNIAKELADTLVETRNSLADRNMLYRKSC